MFFLCVCCFKDTRDIDEARRNTVIKKIQESANSIARKRKVKLSEFKIVNQDPPALSDKLVIKKMAEASTELNLSHKMMISRAYHDSLFMARYLQKRTTLHRLKHSTFQIRIG